MTWARADWVRPFCTCKPHWNLLQEFGRGLLRGPGLPDVDVDESTPRILPNSTQAQGLSHNLCCNALTLFAL